jgi:hypothetical protein
MGPGVDQESNPDVPLRRRLRCPLHHRREVPPRGLEPLQSGLKVRCPSRRARAAWLATAESKRAIPVHQTGPVDRLGRGQRKCAENGAVEAHAVRRALVSGEARHPSRFVLLVIACARRDSNPYALRPRIWAACVSQLRHERVEWMAGIEPATSAMATPRSPELSYIHWEPSPGVEPGALSLPRTCACRRGGRWAGGTATAERCPLPRHLKPGPSRCPESVLSEGFEPPRPSTSGWCLLPLGYESAEPLTGLEPVAFHLRGGRSSR